MDREPPSTKRCVRIRTGRRDLDPSRQCHRCGVSGLRYGNKSGLCNHCRASQPGLVKAAGSADLPTIVARLVRAVVDWFGEARAPDVLGIDRHVIDAALAGQRIIGLQSDGIPSEPSQFEPHVIQLMMARYWALRPLDPSWSSVIAPWRAAMRIEADSESTAARRRRIVETADRRSVTRHVPRITAPLDHSRAGDAFGGLVPGAPRGDVPMRIAVGLWALGFGAVRITRIARQVGVRTSPSAIGRMLKQAERRFDNAETLACQRLAAELDTRPLTRRGSASPPPVL